MGVSRTDYIIYGWKLPFDLKKSNGEKIDDKFLPMLEGHKGEEFSFISDGMCEDYTVFGLNINSDSDGWDFVNIDIKKLDPEKVKAKMKTNQLQNHIYLSFHTFLNTKYII